MQSTRSSVYRLAPESAMCLPQEKERDGRHLCEVDKSCLGEESKGQMLQVSDTVSK